MDDLQNNLDQKTLDLKNDLSAALYTYLTGLHSQIETNTSTEIANDVVLSVLSLNLGHVIGQLDPAHHKTNIKLVNQIIKEQITEVSKLNDAHTFGIIGHA
jgi:hypothetical protein